MTPTAMTTAIAASTAACHALRRFISLSSLKCLSELWDIRHAQTGAVPGGRPMIVVPNAGPRSFDDRLVHRHGFDMAVQEQEIHPCGRLPGAGRRKFSDAVEDGVLMKHVELRRRRDTRIGDDGSQPTGGQARYGGGKRTVTEIETIVVRTPALAGKAGHIPGIRRTAPDASWGSSLPPALYVGI